MSYAEVALIPETLYKRVSYPNTETGLLLQQHRIPCFDMQHFVATLASQARLWKSYSSSSVQQKPFSLIDSGSKGHVFRIQAGLQDVALKIREGLGAKSRNISTLLSLADVGGEKNFFVFRGLTRMLVGEAQDMPANIRGAIIGNSVLPAHIDKPLAVFLNSNNHSLQIAGYTLPTYEGAWLTYRQAGRYFAAQMRMQQFETIMNTLQAANVKIDDGGKNFVVLKSGRLKIIDLEA